MGTTPATFPNSVASFRSDTYNFDPLLADECISISAQLSSGQGILKRGQVLCGWAVGTARNVALSTAGVAGSVCAILAQDIDTGSGSAVTGIVYVQGKFLVTGLIASSNGLEIDSAELWNVGMYVLTVQQRSGLLVPWRSFPATPSVPLPQVLSPEDARKANREQVEAIRAAIDANNAQALPDEPPLARGSQDPAWFTAEFGERDLNKEEAAREKISQSGNDLRLRQHKDLSDLEAKHAKELADLNRKLHDERGQHAKQSDESLKQARQSNGGSIPPVANPSTTPKK
jgi:hypothetical protein